MIIRCWGARGSIPVCGRKYLKYGGCTTCMELVGRDGRTVIVDAGTGIRSLGSRMLKEGRDRSSLIFTHAHMDHMMGFPFFRPIYFKRTRLELFGCPFSQEGIAKMISRTMSPPSFPVNFKDVAATINTHGPCLSRFRIGSMAVTPIRLSHPGQGLGYDFEEKGRRFVFLTDNELTYKHPGGLEFADYRDFCEGADVLFHDAEFTAADYRRTRTWGHSVYTEALRLALEAKVKRFGLYHHNQERGDAAIDRMVARCRRIIRRRGSKLDCFAVRAGMQLEL